MRAYAGSPRVPIVESAVTGGPLELPLQERVAVATSPQTKLSFMERIFGLMWAEGNQQKCELCVADLCASVSPHIQGERNEFGHEESSGVHG